MIRTSAPGRAGILGNPTDGYGGAVIACATRARARVSFKPGGRGLTVVSGVQRRTLNDPEDFQPRGDEFDIVRAVVRFLGAEDLSGELRLATEIPRQAGLAGSTAHLSAVLAALLAARGERCTPYAFAEMNRVVELQYMQVQCGYNDAYMTTFGGLNYMDFRRKEVYRPLEEEPYATIEPLARFVGPLPFVVAHTGLQHHSGAFHRPLRERWLEGEPAVVDGYRRIAELAHEGKKALLERDWYGFGRLMNENWRIQESLAPSGEANERLVNAALESGALGAKLAGAGGGGTIIALTLDREKTIAALRRAGAAEIVELDPNAPGVQTDAEERIEFGPPRVGAESERWP